MCNNKIHLFWQMVKRDVESRYRGSALGILWSLITPLVMLAVYTFVFSVVFKLRWNSAGADDSTQNFAITLFSGLILHQFLADVITRAPSLMQSNVQFVKKIVFPLEILVPVVVFSSLFQLMIGICILLVANLVVGGSLSFTILLLPIILLPFIILTIGAGWILSAIGTYVRDIGHFMGLLVTILLFISTIFYKASALPEYIQTFIYMNPLSYIVDAARGLIFQGKLPEVAAFATYSAISLIIFFIGNLCFAKLKKGFNDVL